MLWKDDIYMLISHFSIRKITYCIALIIWGQPNEDDSSCMSPSENTTWMKIKPGLCDQMEINHVGKVKIEYAVHIPMEIMIILCLSTISRLWGWVKIKQSSVWSNEHLTI